MRKLLKHELFGPLANLASVLGIARRPRECTASSRRSLEDWSTKACAGEVRYPLAYLIGNRVFDIACGHPDGNDADHLAQIPSTSCC